MNAIEAAHLHKELLYRQLAEYRTEIFARVKGGSIEETCLWIRQIYCFDVRKTALSTWLKAQPDYAYQRMLKKKRLWKGANSVNHGFLKTASSTALVEAGPRDRLFLRTMDQFSAEELAALQAKASAFFTHEAIRSRRHGRLRSLEERLITGG